MFIYPIVNYLYFEHTALIYIIFVLQLLRMVNSIWDINNRHIFIGKVFLQHLYTHSMMQHYPWWYYGDRVTWTYRSWWEHEKFLFSTAKCKTQFFGFSYPKKSISRFVIVLYSLPTKYKKVIRGKNLFNVTKFLKVMWVW